LEPVGPAKLAYGGTQGPEEEQRAFETSLSAGADLFDTAAMDSGGVSERHPEMPLPSTANQAGTSHPVPHPTAGGVDP
jgi:hypothetical protein